MDQGHGESRISAIGAMSGAYLLAVGTYLHSSKADPNDATTAVAEYAANHPWLRGSISSNSSVSCSWQARLSSYLGGWPMAPLLIGLIWDYGGDRKCGRDVGTQAVDGVALKVMGDKWVEAGENEKPMLFKQHLQ